jgi:hypothetical protein
MAKKKQNPLVKELRNDYADESFFFDEVYDESILGIDAIKH